ncbi:hypothetical protein MIB92_00280 [Aestuariirhabdus sp. Z084]|uniref:hypothetical protein n=1 Tax=Aestuariirhabdus haliotis TaxID=2918751 RepID=UPI0020BDA76D|nr:hypothetical protein [Aestuariirhabdus haliotis]MCL6414072.1 hypothetical protein [Aestuariirhabdus haliotis]
MLVWDETDVLAVLEVVPEVEPDGIWHVYSVEKNGVELRISIYQYDGDVRFELFNAESESPMFSMQLLDCSGVRWKNDPAGEYLEFAPAKCFGSRYDGESPIPYGVRVYVKPTINVSLF